MSTKRVVPDVLRLHCSPAVAAAAQRLLRTVERAKNVASVWCSADDATGVARLVLAGPEPLLPLQLEPVLALLAAHPRTRTRFSAAQPTALRVLDGREFGALPQLPATPAEALAAACGVAPSRVVEDAHLIRKRACARFTAPAGEIDLCDLLNHSAALEHAWLDAHGGRVALLVPLDKP